MNASTEPSAPLRRRLGRALGVIVGLLGSAVLALLFWPVPIDPIAWTPGPNPAGTAPFLPNNDLAGVELLEVGPGPESVALAPDGTLVTGLEDGRVMRVFPDGRPPEELADTGGRPLGMEFDADGRLYIADGQRGLLALEPDGELKVLVPEIEGREEPFLDDLAIDDQGRVWFTEASTRFPLREFMSAGLEDRPAGQLLRYDPATGRTETMLEGIAFANGVALAADESFVAVSESARHRVRRLWLTGPRKGTDEVLVDLPGFPDNLTEAPDGGFWVTLSVPRSPAVDGLSPRPFVRKIVWRLYQLGFDPADMGHGWVVRLDPEGRPTASLEDASGALPHSTSAIERDGKLFVGSLFGTGIGVLPWPR